MGYDKEMMIRGEREKHKPQQAEKFTGESLAEFELQEKTVSSDYCAAPIPAKTRGRRFSLQARISDMRRLSKRKAVSTYHLYIAKDAELFVRQGKLLESVEHPPLEPVPCRCGEPTYEELSDAQLLYYLSWRTKVRKGNIESTYLAYVYLYAYELINHIGVADATDGFAQLARLINRCKGANQELDRLLCIWLKEFYVVNAFTEDFSSLLNKFSLTTCYPELMEEAPKQKLSFAFLGHLSSYPIERSKFLRGEPKKLLEKCFDSVMQNFSPLFTLYGLNIEDLVEGKPAKSYWWRLFHGAVYQPVVTGDKEVIISGKEYYVCKDNLWSYYRPAQNNSELSMIVGYLVKRIEARLRILMKHRYALSADELNLRDFLLYAGGAYQAFWKVMTDPYFGQIIDSATIAYYRKWKEDPNTLPEKVKSPVAEKIRKQLKTEPYRTICEVRNLIKLNEFSHQGDHFMAQAKAFATLEAEGEISNIPTAMEFPSYLQMSIEEIKSYFIWRTNWRANKEPENIFPFIKLYAAELICGIGSEEPLDTLKKLTQLLLFYEKGNIGVKRMLTAYVKDYYICQGIALPFDQLVRSLHLESFYANTLLAMASYGSWYRLLGRRSDYEIEKSRFFSAEKEPILEGCFNEVMTQLTNYFSRHEIDVFTLMTGAVRSDHTWRPFAGGILPDEMTKKDVVVELSRHEIYHCKDGYWWCEKYPEEAQGTAQLAGYVLKRTEAQLRRLTQDKYKLTPKISSLISALSARKEKWKSAAVNAVSNEAFDQTIDDAVAAHIRQHHPEILRGTQEVKERPVKVTIDKDLLQGIREKAAQNQEKLLSYGEVPDEQTAETEGQAMTGDTVSIDPDVLQSNPGKLSDAVLIEESGWGGLRQALTVCEKEALVIIAAGHEVTEQLFCLASDNGIMREVLFEHINEKALDFIGDSLIEGQEKEIFIYEDYLNEVKAILE